MKTIMIETETRPLAEWLPKEDSEDLVFLTREGRPRFVLVPLDEGDQEVLAVQKNAGLMAYISASVERARTGPTKTLEQIEAELGLADDAQAAAPASAVDDALRNHGTGPH